MTRRPLIERRRTSPALAAWVAGTTILGLATLALATATLPVAASIGGAHLPVIVGDRTVSGVLFWIILGFAGSLRVRGYRGRSALTFHLPFAVAAMTLGGPVAAGWLGAISTLERRELREAPWFGALQNHALLAFCGVLGGLVVWSVDDAVARLGDPQAALFVAALAAALVVCLVNIGTNAITVGLRERLTAGETLATFDRSYRGTMAGEVVLGWLLAVGYTAIAWWLPLACVVLVLMVWRANDEHEATTHDPMTGLLNRRGFDERLASALWRARRGRGTAALVMVDLDRFKAINDGFGHLVGDEVIRATGARLSAAVRLTDAAARLGGDEFALLLERVPDAAAAEGIVRRIHDVVCQPLELAGNEIRVGASFGVQFLDRERAAQFALDAADRAMYEKKRQGGGVLIASGGP